MREKIEKTFTYTRNIEVTIPIYDCLDYVRQNMKWDPVEVLIKEWFSEVSEFDDRVAYLPEEYRQEVRNIVIDLLSKERK